MGQQGSDHEHRRNQGAESISRRAALTGSMAAGLCCAAADARTTGRTGRIGTPKIDIYNHVIPRAYLELMQQRFKDPGLLKRMSSVRTLWDIDARAAMLDQWPELQQVLTLANPGPEALGGPDDSPHAARVANDGMAAFVARHPHKFPAFVAAVPMNNVAATLAEMDRAIGKLGARGIEIKTNVNGRPLDDPAFRPVFEHAANVHKVPVWMHPIRTAARADYASESKSTYEIWQVLGLPYDTSAAMSRMVFSGLFDRYPDLSVITHHCGGMFPFFGGRAEMGWAEMGSRTQDEDLTGVTKALKRPFMDYFRNFYGDTVLNGSTAALRCGLEFFGPERVVFATDCPFDPEHGPRSIHETLRSIEALDLAGPDRRKIYCDNARRLLKADVRPLHLPTARGPSTRD